MTVLLCFVVVAVVVELGSCQTIAESPEQLCVQDAGELNDPYEYHEGTSYNYWEGVAWSFRIAVVDDRWVFWDSYYHSIPSSYDASEVESYCTGMPSNYTPTSDEAGDPRDCTAWDGYSKLDMTGDYEECIRIDTSLSWIDWVFLVFAVILFFILSLYMCPFGPYKSKCKQETYPAAMLETYGEIMKLHGLFCLILVWYFFVRLFLFRLCGKMYTRGSLICSVCILFFLFVWIELKQDLIQMRHAVKKIIERLTKHF